MFYKKPSNVSYVEMAIYIDENVHKKDRDDNLIFEYMWHLFYILAVKRRFFSTDRDYNEYALYSATRLYMRYKREDEEGNKLKPIKSCLNYIKKVLYPMKVDYQQSFFEQVVREDKAKDSAYGQLYEDRASAIRKTSSDLLKIDCDEYLKSICATIRYTIKDIPYKNDKVMMHNIYLSCLLTFLKGITISNKNKERISNRTDKSLSVCSLIDSIYAQEMKDSIVTYHLDNSLQNYIAVLVARIKREVIKDLRDIIGYHEPSEQVIKDVLMSPMEEYLNEQQ